MDKSKRASKTEDQTYDRKYFDHLIQEMKHTFVLKSHHYSPL